jgi:tripartite-type tricarboxylate transporter receptor subunit TctC
MSGRPWRAALAAWIVSMALAVPALAQPEAFPARPMRFIVPFAPGGPVDVVARLIAPRIAEQTGHAVVVDNRPGAGGNIGAALAAKAAPDGHTVLFTSSSIVVNPTLFEKPGYDLFRDLVPVTRATAATIVFVIHPSLPVKTMQEFIALVRAHPRKYTYGSPGTGTTGHLSCELMNRLAKLDLEHVPYAGAAPLATALLGNQVAIGCPGLPTVLAQLRAGQLRALASTLPQRVALIPEVPAMAEVGFPGFATDLMTGVFVPAGTPPAIVDRLQREVARILALPEVRDKIAAQGFEVVANTPREFAKQVRAEFELYGRIVREAKIKPD